MRPRVLGVKASGLLETEERAKFPIEFEGPSRDTDTFEIAIPAGYVVDDILLPSMQITASPATTRRQK